MPRLASSHIALKLAFIQTPPVLPVERQNSELLRRIYCKPLEISLRPKTLRACSASETKKKLNTEDKEEAEGF
jgi:hypothetical protein